MILLTFLLLWSCFEVMRDVRGNDGLMVKIVAVLVIKKIVAVLFKGFMPYFCCFPSFMLQKWWIFSVG